MSSRSATLTRGPQRRGAVRRFSGIALATCLALGAAACSDDDSGGGSGGGSEADADGVAEASAAIEELADQPFSVEPLSATPPTGKTVAYVTCTLPACRPGTAGDAAEALGWTVNDFTFDYTGGPQAFVAALEAALASGPDYIVMNGTLPNEVSAAQVAQAEAEGIPIVQIAAEDPPASVEANILGNSTFVTLAQTTARQILSRAGGPVEVAVPFDPTLISFTASVDAFEEELLRMSPSSKVDRLELSLALPPTEIASQQVNFLRTNPDADVLAYVGGGGLYQGVGSALQSAGLADQVEVVFGWMVNPSEVEALQSGDVVSGTVSLSNYEWMYMDILARLAVGDPIDPEPAVPWVGVVTGEDATPEDLNPPNYQDAYEQAWQVG